uniref:Uncharacterized protein n=1 Tax=Oryza barthii TaxID=65489 RepID=A0A0D3GRE3_9ORYZ
MVAHGSHGEERVRWGEGGGSDVGRWIDTEGAAGEARSAWEVRCHRIWMGTKLTFYRQTIKSCLISQPRCLVPLVELSAASSHNHDGGVSLSSVLCVHAVAA